MPKIRELSAAPRGVPLRQLDVERPSPGFSPDVRAGLPVRGGPPVGLSLDSDLTRAHGVDRHFASAIRSRVYVPGSPPWLIKNQTGIGFAQDQSQPLQKFAAYGIGVHSEAGNNYFTPSGGLIMGASVPVGGQSNLLVVKNNPVINGNGQVDPSTTAIASVGNRVRSWIGSLTYVTTTTSVTWYWDGTNGSTPLTIYRDDQTVLAVIKGSMAVTGLTISTNYYFYAYYDETLKGVVFVGSQKGSNGTAWLTATSLAAMQQVGLAGRIAIGSGMLAATPGSSTTTGTGGGSGGTNGGRSVI